VVFKKGGGIGEGGEGKGGGWGWKKWKKRRCEREKNYREGGVSKNKGKEAGTERGGREGWSTKTSGGREEGRKGTVGYGTVSQSRFNKFMIQDSFIAYAEHFRSLVNYGQKKEDAVRPLIRWKQAIILTASSDPKEIWGG